ncbi:MAG: DUF58 domain-containing protein, partial [Actinomycetia bacterium]|nr:DUF58 domain-containing protein [Actinomycetes bacterium]
MINKKIILISSLSVSLFFIASNIQAGWVFLIVSILISLLIFSSIYSHINLSGLIVKRVLPFEMYAGESIDISLEIKNQGFAKYLIRAKDNFLSFNTDVLFSYLPKKEKIKKTYRAMPLGRGVFDGGQLVLSTAAPFGIFEAKKKLFLSSPAVVYPKYFDLTNFPLLESVSFPVETIHERRKGHGDEYYGVREYRFGDSLRHIHWKSSARKNELIVKEFERGYRAEVNLLLDTNKDFNLGTKPETSFEYMVEIAASISNYVLKTGHSINLFSLEKQMLMFLQRPDWRQILECLAKIKANGEYRINDLVNLSQDKVSQRSTVIILTTSNELLRINDFLF